MPDEAPSVEDQPIDATGAPETDPSLESTETASFADFDTSDIPDELREDVEKRIKGFQRSYTQAMQEISGERQEAEEARRIVDALTNEATQAQMLAALNIQLPQQQSEYGEEFLSEEDRLERIQQELEETKGQFSQFLQTQQTAAAEQEEDEKLAVQMIGLEDNVANRQFSEEEFDLITSLAYQRRNAQGEPDAKAAFDLLTGAVTQNRDAWVTKRKATPRRMASGTPASETVDRTDPEQRRAGMLRAAEELQGSQ